MLIKTKQKTMEFCDNANTSDSTRLSCGEAFVTLPTITSEQINNLKVCFCIDISGSTGNNFADNCSVLDVETNFVASIFPELTRGAKFVAWDDQSINIVDISKLNPAGGTDPSCIFQNKDTLDTLHDTEVAVIITDGEIGISEINAFSKCMTNHGAHLKAIIGVIVGRRTDVKTGILKKPTDIGVSVLAPAMLSNGCILFHNWNDTYVMSTCGVFKTAWNPVEIENGVGWDNLTKLNFRQIVDVVVPIPDPILESDLRRNGYIPFGAGLYFNADKLLASNPSWDELVQMPFDRVCQYFRVTLQYEKLLEWFKIQKDRFLTEFMTDEDDKLAVENLVKNISGRERTRDPSLISSYIRARDRTLARRYVDDNEIDDLFDDPRLVQLMQFFRQMMEIMEEDNRTQYQVASYTTSSISSSRYCRPSYHVPTSLGNSGRSKSTTITADFTEPLKWIEQFARLYPGHNSIQCECSICCETKIPFILFRKHIDKNNVNDILDCPTNYFYPQMLCAKCAAFFCSKGTDPVHIPCYGALPIVSLIGDSNKYYFSGFVKLTNFVLDADKSSLTKSITTSTSALLGWLGNSTKKSFGDSELHSLMFTASLFYGVLLSHFTDSNEISMAIKQITDVIC
ncbi:hypothetical protein QJ856_gp0038 [Tupanvirus deep ocean]|uniref:Uncharacterized protein n=2 Tax=Tupanvirus TaxID=2094720 RepID=A0AC62A6N6_9VIRU|nr:hypothetical protein QJ856_gp0038 [Tupanvirus deep ocean]QKU33454.1 hypothetical protein [Tupanvirus deep ocean]